MEKLQHAEKGMIWSHCFNIYGLNECTGLKLLVVLWICQNGNLIFLICLYKQFDTQLKYHFKYIFLYDCSTSHHNFIGFYPFL